MQHREVKCATTEVEDKYGLRRGDRKGIMPSSRHWLKLKIDTLESSQVCRFAQSILGVHIVIISLRTDKMDWSSKHDFRNFGFQKGARPFADCPHIQCDQFFQAVLL